MGSSTMAAVRGYAGRVGEEAKSHAHGRTDGAARERPHVEGRCSRQKVGSKAEVGLKSGYYIVVRG